MYACVVCVWFVFLVNDLKWCHASIPQLSRQPVEDPVLWWLTSVNIQSKNRILVLSDLCHAQHASWDCIGGIPPTYHLRMDLKPVFDEGQCLILKSFLFFKFSHSFIYLLTHFIVYILLFIINLLLISIYCSYIYIHVYNIYLIVYHFVYWFVYWFHPFVRFSFELLISSVRFFVRFTTSQSIYDYVCSKKYVFDFFKTCGTFFRR